MASLGAQTVKSLPAVQGIQDQSLGREDLPEKLMATHSSILAWKIPRTEKPGATVHGILQARILEWVAFSFSKGSSQPRDRTQVSTLQAASLPAEPPGKAKS